MTVGLKLFIVTQAMSTHTGCGGGGGGGGGLRGIGQAKTFP